MVGPDDEVAPAGPSPAALLVFTISAVAVILAGGLMCLGPLMTYVESRGTSTSWMDLNGNYRMDPSEITSVDHFHFTQNGMHFGHVGGGEYAPDFFSAAVAWGGIAVVVIGGALLASKRRAGRWKRVAGFACVALGLLGMLIVASDWQSAQAFVDRPVFGDGGVDRQLGMGLPIAALGVTALTVVGIALILAPNLVKGTAQEP